MAWQGRQSTGLKTHSIVFFPLNQLLSGSLILIAAPHLPSNSGMKLWNERWFFLFPKSCHSFFPVPLSQVSSLFAQLSLKFRPVCPLLGSWEELPNPSSSRFAAKSEYEQRCTLPMPSTVSAKNISLYLFIEWIDEFSSAYQIKLWNHEILSS